MSSLRGALIGIAPLLLAACASVSPPSRPDSDVANASAATSYGLFLAGQAAVNSGDSASAETLFSEAAASRGGSADDGFLQGRAFTFALLAGDIGKAAAEAPTGPGVDPQLVQLGDLVRGVEDLAEGKAKAARIDIKAAEGGKATGIAASLLAPYAAAEAGDLEASIGQPVIPEQPIAQFFARLDQGEFFERAHRYDEAETAWRALIAKGDPGGLASLHLGEMLQRRGRRADAAAIFAAALARNGDNDTLVAANARLAAGKPPTPLPSLRRSASEALIASASAFVAGNDYDDALAFLRLALRLDSTRDEAWMLVGDVLEVTGDLPGARAAWLTPKPGSPQYESARAKLAWSYQTADDKEQALATARATLAAVPKDQDAAITLADLLRADEHYAESARLLDGLIAAQGDHPDWKLLYMRAVDLEESGRWADAERDLQQALKSRPNDPELLNFLGYSWIDRGERLGEALAMVQKAVMLDPKSGAMIDSLGWGYYRLGDYHKAVDNLEKAVALEPGDPDVNNHLGDAYWRVGRKLEARFQWDRVLTLDPSPKLKTEVEGKLKTGLDGPPLPAQVAAEAAHS